ncbi:MFS transporter [Streptomyces capparidis]
MSRLDEDHDDIPLPGTPVPPSAEAAEEGVLGRTYRALTLGIVSVVSLIAFEATAVNTAMPSAADDLDGLSLYAYAFSGFYTTSLFAMVVSGQWCDRRGPLAPLFAGIGAFVAGLLVSGAAGNMWTFVGGRSIQGLGSGLVIVALYVIVGRVYPERLRPAVMASFSSAWVVPAIVGPAVSGTVTEHLGWRWVFLAIPALVAAPLLVMLPALRRADGSAAADRPVNERRVWLALGVAAGAGLLQYAGQDLRPVALLPAALGLALLVPSVLRLLPRGTFRAARGLPSVVLLRGVAAGSFLGAESFLPLMLVSERDLSVTLAGLSLAGGGLTWALGSYLQSRPRLEPHRESLILVGMLLMTSAVGGAALALLDPVPPWIVAVAWAVGGLGMGLTISSVSVLLLRLSRPEDAGENSASLQVSDALGNIVLVGAGGVVFAALGGGSVAVHGHEAATSSHPTAFAGVLLSMTAVALAGVWVARRVRPPREKSTTAAP